MTEKIQWLLFGKNTTRMNRQITKTVQNAEHQMHVMCTDGLTPNGIEITRLKRKNN